MNGPYAIEQPSNGIVVVHDTPDILVVLIGVPPWPAERQIVQRQELVKKAG